MYQKKINQKHVSSVPISIPPTDWLFIECFRSCKFLCFSLFFLLDRNPSSVNALDLHYSWMRTCWSSSWLTTWFHWSVFTTPTVMGFVSVSLTDNRVGPSWLIDCRQSSHSGFFFVRRDRRYCCFLDFFHYCC